MASVVTQYEQLSAGSMQGLCDLVNAAIEKGFQPFGGPIIHNDVMVQAIVKMDWSQEDGMAHDISEINQKIRTDHG